MSLRKLPTRSRTLDAEYGYCVLEVAAVAVATVVSDAVEALSRLIGAVVVEVAGSDMLCCGSRCGCRYRCECWVAFRHCDVRCDGDAGGCVCIGLIDDIDHEDLHLFIAQP
jgi:hypothetical protein